jgi:hypothetical protein
MEDQAAFSPDGKSLAFVSTFSGNADIYLLPFRPGQDCVHDTRQERDPPSARRFPACLFFRSSSLGLSVTVSDGTVRSGESFMREAPGAQPSNPSTNSLRSYLLSVPERVIRSATALSAGLLRELGEAALPASVRRTRVYQTMVESTLRFLIEQVGEVEDAYLANSELPRNFLVRRTVGNGIEMLGLIAFRASPVWVMAALADLSGTGRHLVKEIAASLQAEGLLDPDRSFESVEQLLDGLERTAGRLSEAVNTPPLDIATLRKEWAELKREAAVIPLPPVQAIRSMWEELKREADAQGQTIFQLSSVMALSAISGMPENTRWLSRCATLAARRTGCIFASGLLDHYRETLTEIRHTGYLAYGAREFRPYLRAAAAQFSRNKGSVTRNFLFKRRRSRI